MRPYAENLSEEQGVYNLRQSDQEEWLKMLLVFLLHVGEYLTVL